jgi:hypothetical protein
MPVTFELPTDLERSLREELPDLNQAAKEALIVDLYRNRRISHYQLAQALDVDRFEADAVLKRHNVTEDLPSAADLEDDRRALDRVLGPVRR